MKNYVFFLKKQPGFYGCEQKAVLFDVCSERTLFQLLSDGVSLKKKSQITKHGMVKE